LTATLPIVIPIPAPLQDASKFSLSSDLGSIKRVEKQALFEILEKTTHFGKSELEQLYEGWAKQAVDGKLGKDQFAIGLSQLGITDPLTIEQNFNAFDENKDGRINFKEFVCGLSVILRGSVEERLRLIFNSYDSDGNGFLDTDEVYNIFKASLISKGNSITDSDIKEMVYKVFKEVDVNNDGKLSYDEFKKAVENQQILVSCFVHYKQ